MLIVRPAQEMGMCFGVRDALQMAAGLPDPTSVTIHGELVHNPVVNRQLKARGYQISGEADRASIPDTPTVMVTAHGVSNRERQRLQKAGKQIVDTTCPLVRKAHKMILHAHRRGHFIVMVGRSGHVEVEGLIGDIENYVIVSSPEQVRHYPYPILAVAAQTTTPQALFAQVLARVQHLNSQAQVRPLETICRPTRDRQSALQDMLGRVEAVVVVGGRHSNNTRQLGLAAGERGLPYQQVESAEELDVVWLRRFRIVGLTAGTSTPDESIAMVHRRMLDVSKRSA